jgi:hypothetical protein
MASGWKLDWRVWTESLAVLARSPVYVLALAAIAGLCGWAGYEWLWLPESSWFVLAIALVWILALAVLVVAAVSGTAWTAAAAASRNEQSLSVRTILRLARLRSTGPLVLAALVGFVVLAALFGWINDHSLSVASFLTFRSQQAVSYKLIGGIFWAVEALIWIIVAGASMQWLILASNPRSPATASVSSRPARFSFTIFVTGILAAGVFGGAAWLLAIWRPLVQSGLWDYVQLIVRVVVALIALTLGWLFWALSLARFIVPRPQETATPPPPA